MSLIGILPQGAWTTGTKGTAVKPITEGERVLMSQTPVQQSSPWSFLDSLGQKIGTTVGNVVDAYGRKVTEEVNPTPAATQTTRANPDDQAGNTNTVVTSVTQFYDDNRTAIHIVGAVVGAYLVYRIVK